jgi:hypothetical protein
MLDFFIKTSSINLDLIKLLIGIEDEDIVNEIKDICDTVYSNGFKGILRIDYIKNRFARVRELDAYFQDDSSQEPILDLVLSAYDEGKNARARFTTHSNLKIVKEERSEDFEVPNLKDLFKELNSFVG